jgi:hypothetical protein
MTGTPPSRGIPWWLKPFVGAFVALLGACVTMLIVSVPIGLAMGRGCGEAISKGLTEVLDRWVPPDRPPDLDIAPGAPGYLQALGFAGRQLHFHDADKGVTSVAVEAWLDGHANVRTVVGRYDGPPTATLARALLRRVEPILPMLVVRVSDAIGVWWAFEGGPPHGPCLPEAGELNLVVLPGKLALWNGDGPRHGIEVGWHETVRCTLGPAGLTVEQRIR